MAKTYSLIIIVCALFIGCATHTINPSKSDYKDPDKIFAKGVELQSSGDLRSAYKTFMYLTQEYPNHRLARKALFNAAIIMDKTDPVKAIGLFERFIKLYPASPLTKEAKEHLFLSYIKNGKYEKAVRLLKDLKTSEPDPTWITLGLRLVNAYIESGRAIDALDIIPILYKRADAHTHALLYSIWTTIIKDIKQIEVLNRLEDKVKDPKLTEALISQKTKIYLEQQDHWRLGKDMERGRTVLKGEEDTCTNVIGVVLPLSGKWQTVGHKILKGIELASEVFSPPVANKSSNICFVIKDYGEDETKIPSLIEDLDKDGQVIAIIGPVGEKACRLTCNLIQQKGIPTIIFTQADLRPVDNSFCFRNFISTNIQVKALLNVANSMNINKFAILYPTDHFGTVFTSTFEDMVWNYGIEVVKTVGYSPDKTDFKEEIRNLVPEGEVPDFEALLIPDTGMNAAMIASYLTYYNIEGIRLFGPSLWNTQDFTNIGGKYVEDATFLSGFFLNSKLECVQNFIDSFYYTFGYNPSIWEASAYDTATILQNLLQGQMLTRSSLRESICSLKDYPGVTGATSFNPDGSVDKVIFVLTVKNSHIIEASPY
ncbi:MAG: ABC transporter substrate-binding protein [Deltaproteobacteria bacterium]|nr:ABC transporter substrate-binding protein [Deltaproteobacteria bacterium]